jgi:hypothetical protein
LSDVLHLLLWRPLGIVIFLGWWLNFGGRSFHCGSTHIISSLFAPHELDDVHPHSSLTTGPPRRAQRVHAPTLSGGFAPLPILVRVKHRPRAAARRRGGAVFERAYRKDAR